MKAQESHGQKDDSTQPGRSQSAGRTLRPASRPSTSRLSAPCILGILLAGFAHPIQGQTVLLAEGFEGLFPGDWFVRDGNPEAGLSHWADVPAIFGGEGAHSGNWKGYCAGSNFAGSAEDPGYLNSMESSMGIPVDLRGYAGASLSFWYKIPSIESPYDTAKVIINSIDPVTAWSSSEVQGNWTEVTIDLSPYVGTVPGVSFVFTSDGSVTAEGWYLDDVLVTAYAPPVNDRCDGAVALATCVPAETDTTWATEVDDPTPICQGNTGKGVWFSYTPPEDGRVRIHTLGSDFDTVLQIFGGECGALLEIPGACNDDDGPAGGGTSASVEFEGRAGIRYYILAGGFGAAGGNLRIVAEPAVAPPLRVARRGGEIVLSWPPRAVSWRLHASPNLEPGSWVPLGNAGSFVGGENVVTDPIADPQRFYTLRCEGQAISTEEVVQVADTHARALWAEDLLAEGEPIPIGDGEGAPFSYVVPIARGAATFPSNEVIFATVAQLKSNYGPFPADGSESLPEEFYTALEELLGPIGFVQISATRENFPVLLTQDTLHPWYLFQDSARNRARQVLGNNNVEVEGYVMKGPCDEYFSCGGGGQRIYVHARSLETLTPAEFGEVPTFRVPPELAAEREQAWEEVLGREAPLKAASQLKWIRNYDLIPIVDWTYWCVPTAFTMVIGYYDHYEGGRKIQGFGRIIDFWSRNGTGHNVPNFIDEIIDPTLTPRPTWRVGTKVEDILNDASWNGYRFRLTDVRGGPDNDWAWSGLVAEIDADRPAVWSSTPTDPAKSGHAMAAYGYRVVGAQKFVLVYNTWGTTRKAQHAEYAYDQWIQGGAAGRTGYGQILPGGGDPPNDIVLESPRGWEVLFGASQIAWEVTGNEIQATRIFDSLDGGQTWNLVTTVSTPGAGRYTRAWTPPGVSDRGRVRVVGIDGSGNVVAGDSSVTRVFFRDLPDLVVQQTRPGYCDRRGNQLAVTVANVGPFDAGVSTTAVVFHTVSGPQKVQVTTPAIPAGGAVEVLFNFPPNCTGDCSFDIRADDSSEVSEGNEGNNNVSGTCVG